MSSTSRLRIEALEAREVPAADLAYALPITGLPATAVTRAAADTLGNLYITGTYSGTIDLNPDPVVKALATAAGSTEVFVAKYGPAGQFLWGRTLEGQADESAADIVIDGIGNVYVAGTFTGAVDFNPAIDGSAVLTASAGGSAFLWKLGANGSFVMARTVAGTSSATGVAVDPGGNVLVAGTFTGQADFNPAPDVASNLSSSSTAGFLWKLNQPGGLVWARAFTTTGTAESTAVALDGQGNAYLAGRFTGTADLDPGDASALVAGGTAWTPFVVKLGFNGEYLWGRAVRPVSPVPEAATAINAIGVDGIGNVFAAGVFTGAADFDPGAGTTLLTPTGSSDGFVWKLDPNGNLGYARRFGGVNAETVSDLSVDKAGNTYITGTFTGTGDFDPNSGVALLGSGTGAADGFIMRMGPQGSLTYARALGGGFSTTRPTTIVADGAGTMYVSGAFSGRADFNPGVGTVPLGGGAGAGFIARLFPQVGATVATTDRPPNTASAGGPYTIREGEGLTVKASAVDPEKKALSFNWDLNGDGVFGDAVGAKAVVTADQMRLLNLADGKNIDRTIRVRISDGVNLPIEATAILTIQNTAPTGARIKFPAKVTEGVRPDLSVVGTTDAVGVDRRAGYRVSWDFNSDGVWDLGDGATYAGSAAAAVKMPARFVGDSGPLAVRVRVFDKDGGYMDTTATLLVVEAPPSAGFTLVGTAVVGSPTTVRFVNQKDTAADMEAGFTYSFDLDNDGAFETHTGRTPEATVTFPFRGKFTVRGMIIDQDGAFTVYSLDVNVA